MFEVLKESDSDYENYCNKVSKLYKEKYMTLDKLEQDYMYNKSKYYNRYDSIKNEIIKNYNSREDILKYKNIDMLNTRELYIQGICRNSSFDLKIIGSSLARIMSYIKESNYEFNEENVLIDTVCYGGRFLDKILETKKEEVVCGYISKNGIFPKQEYPIEYNDSLHALFRKDDLLLYESRKTNAKEHIVRFYGQFCGSIVSYCPKELQDFVDELIKYKLESDDELTAEKCEELADLYISELKKDKPKTLSKQL